LCGAEEVITLLANGKTKVDHRFRNCHYANIDALIKIDGAPKKILGLALPSIYNLRASAIQSG